MSAAARVSFLDVLQIVDIRTKIVSVSSLLIGTVYAYSLTHQFSPLLFLLMLAATLLVDMGTTGFNSYYDFLRGVDTVHTDVERWKALVQRHVDPALAWKLAWLLFVLAAAFGLAIGAYVDWRVVLVGAACMLIALAYSGGPLPIASMPVGEVFAGGLLGAVLIAVAAFVQMHALDARVWWLGLPSSVLIATILSVNNACDIEGDARAGRRTLAIVLGRERAETMIHAQCGATLVLALALIPLGVLSLATAIPLALVAAIGWRELRAMHARGFSHATKAACMGGISKVFMAYTAAILLATGVAAWATR